MRTPAFLALSMLLLGLAIGSCIGPDRALGLDERALRFTHVVVQDGDSLSVLAEEWPGGWTRAAFVNDLSNPDFLEVGQVLLIPRHDGRRFVPARPSAAASRSSTSTGSTMGFAEAGGGLDWLALFQCESGNNPRAVSPSGTYRGLAQWDAATWASLGMSGDPIDHSYAEQAAAARRLYAARGRAPWPVCGAYL